MKRNLLLLIIISPLFTFSQPRHLKLTNLETGTSSFVKKGDKVLIAYKLPRHEAGSTPSGAYVFSKAEQADSVFVFVKARLLSVGDSTIRVRERNSLFSSSHREVRIEKINSLRKFSAGKQLLRTATTVSGGLALAIAIFYSYAAVGGGEGFITGMLEATVVGSVLTRFGRTKIAKRNLNHWKIEPVVI